MSTHPRLVRSIPFWGLLAASLALVGVGAWLVAERVGRIEAGVLSQTQAGAIDVYASPSVVTAGAAILGAGLIGLLLTLAVAAAATLRPHPPVEVVEPAGTVADDVETDPESAEPVSSEGPDVEVSSDAPAPLQATVERPAP